MGKTILFGPSGFFGPMILKKYSDIIAVGRTPPPSYCKNRFIKIKSISNLKVLDKLDIEKVIFLIGNSNHHYLNKRNIDVALNYNFFPLKIALDYFSKRKKKITKFITFSGALIYDEKKLKLPCKENADLDPYKNNYIFSKYLVEQLARTYSSLLPIINIRLSNIYGPSHLKRPDLINNLFSQSFKKNKKILVNNILPKRDFIFGPDVAEAIIKLLKTDYRGMINIGSGQLTSVKDICKHIESITRKKIINLKKKVSGPYNYCHDISLLQSLINWKPKTSLKIGLNITYKESKVFISKEK